MIKKKGGGRLNPGHLNFVTGFQISNLEIWNSKGIITRVINYIDWIEVLVFFTMSKKLGKFSLNFHKYLICIQ